MVELFKQFGAWAVVDVLIIAVLIYQILILLRGTRAMQMIIGLVLLFGSVFIFSQLYPLNTLKWILNRLSPSLIVVIVILFQDDIRRVLSRMGKQSLINSGNEPISSKVLLDEIVRAASSLASQKIGALITVERNIILNRYIEVGVPLDAVVTKELLLSIFHTSSPLHDGSVIIQQGRVAAAGCFLPLTRDANIDANMGTRHRAGIGITQETDAVVVLVSEEGASMALIADGEVSRNLSSQELRVALHKLLGTPELSIKPAAAEGEQSTRIRFMDASSLAFLQKMRIFGSNKKDKDSSAS